ncbi:MAG: CPBP family intramembrane metalloprotease [Mangrovicoccus sp.]|nr:CPBP family intramembrane metalloprotease [Mangrovicoccus sp.]
MTPRFHAFIAPARARAQIWRSLLGLVLIVLIYLVSLGAALGLYALLAGWGQTEALLISLGAGDSPRAIYIILASFLPIWLGLALVCRWLHQRALATLIGPAARALRDFMRAVLVFGGIYGLGFALYAVFEGSVPHLDWQVWAALLPLTLLGLLIQTGAEELLFRGYLQQQLAARFAHPVIWAWIPAILFGLLHFDPGSMGDLAPFAVIMATAFGLFAADLTARSGSLGAAWGAHFINNFFAMALLTVQDGLGGVALRSSKTPLAEMELSYWVLAIELLPMILAWWLLRRWINLR